MKHIHRNRTRTNIGAGDAAVTTATSRQDDALQWGVEGRIVWQEPMRLVGLEYRGPNANGEIPALWQAFMPRMAEVRRIKDTFGYLTPGETKGEICYLVGSQVTDFERIPDGMVGREVEGGDWLWVECPGLDQIDATYHWFEDEWLPNSGYSARPGCLEYYPPTFPQGPRFDMRFTVQKFDGTNNLL